MKNKTLGTKFVRQFCTIAIAHSALLAGAATIDTTGGATLNFDDPAHTYTGNGTLTVSNDGSGLIELATGSGIGTTTFSMTGGTIDIQSGVTLRNGGWAKGVWTSNLSSLNVAGTLDVWDGNIIYVDALTGAGTITKTQGGANLDVRVGVNNGSGDFSGIMNAGSNGGWTLIKVGTGTQTLSGTADNNSARATVNAGTLILAKLNSASAHAIGTGLTIAGGTAQLGGTGGDQIYDNVVVTLNSGSFDLNGRTETIKGLIGSGGSVGNTSGTQAVLTINHSTISNSGTREYSGAVNGNVRVVLTNSANKNSDVQTFSGSNGYTGGTLIDNGHLRVTSDAGLGAVPGSFDAANVTLQNGGVLQNNNSDPVLHANRGITLGTGGGVIYAGWNKTVTVNGAITGSGNLTKTDGGALILSSTSNNYTGQTLVQQGEIRLAASNVLPNATELVMSGGTVNLNGFTDTVAALSGSSGTVTGGAGTALTVLTTGTKTFTGTVGNAMAFTMNGTGTQTLTGTLIDHTGATTISSGTLKFQDLDDLHSSGVSIASGSTAEFSNSVRNFVRFTNTSISGTGTFVKSGTSTLTTGNAGGYARWNMTGGTIDVQQGTFVADYQDTNATLAWGSNKASMNVASGATVSLVGGNHIMVDALTGSGTVQNINSWGTGIFTVGQNNGGGTFSGVLRDNGGALALTKNGSGTQILSGANTYTQTTTINGGVLQIGDGGTTGTLGTGGVTNNATLRFNRSNAVTVANAIGGTGALVQAGTGTLTLTAVNTYSGATTISAGTFEIGGGGSLGSGAYAGAISNSGTLLYNSTATQTLSGSLSGAGALVKANTGTLILSTAKTYTGATTINGGVLEINGSGSIPTASAITINNGGTLRLSRSDTWGNHTTTSSAPITVNAGGTLASNGVFNTIVNPTLAGGTLQLNGGASANFPAFAIHGTLTVSGSTASNINVGGGSNNFINIGTTTAGGVTTFQVADVAAGADLTVNAPLQNNKASGSPYPEVASGLTKTGAGSLVLAAANTFTGATTISTGTLELGGAGQLGAGSYAGNITNNATLRINTTASQTLSGSMTGSGSLVKDNTGVLTLSTAKAYTGPTTVNAGVVTVSGTGTLSGTSGLSVASGAIFNYTPATIGTMTMGAGSTLAFATGSILGLNWDATTSSRIAALGAATMGSGVKVSMTGAYTSGTPYTILTAASGLDSGSYTAINNVDYTAAFTQSPTSVIITPTTATPLAAAYWKGGTTGYDAVLGVASNWTTDGAGTVSGLTPGAAANVYFSDSGAAAGNQVNMTMGANMALNSITVNGTSGSPVNTNPVSLSATGGYTLTLGSTAGSGITMNTGAGAVTLNPAIALGNSQTWTNNSSNALTVNGAVTNGAGTLTVAGTGNTIINGSLGGGAGGLVKTGAGVLTMNGANTYSGTTTVSQGTLRLGAATGLPNNNNITVASGATFDFNGQGNITTRNYNFTIAGTGVGGQGVINNTSVTGIGGNSSIASLTLAGDASVGANGRWDIGDGGAGRTFNGGGFTLTKVGTGEITFRPQTVSNLAAVNINAGILKFEGFDQTTGATAGTTITINTGGTLSSYGNRSFNMPLVFAGGSMANESGTANWSGTVAFNAPTTINTTQNINLTGTVSGSGDLTRTGGGTVSFGGDTSGYTGNITSSANLVFNRAAGQIINGNITATGALYADVGVLNLASSGSMTASNYVIARSGGTLEFNRSATLSGAGYLGTDTGAGTSTININAGRLVTHNGSNGMIIGQNTINHNGVLNVSGTFVQNAGNAIFGNNQPGATGTLNVNSGGTVTFGAGMSAPGASGGGGILGVVLGRDNATAVGTFNLNAGGVLESAKGMVRGTGQGYFNFNGGTLRALGGTTAFLDVTTTTVNSGGAVVDSNGFDVTIVDGLSAGTGSGGLTKNGAGVLTLAGANTYTGVTAVNAGALTISGTGTLPATSALNVADGAQFNYSPSSPGTLSLAGATLNLASGSTFGTTWGSTIAVAGAASVGGSDVGIEMLSGSFTSGTPYTVLTAAGGLTSGAYVLRNNYNFIATINSSSGTSVILTPTAVAALTTAYWKGGLPGQVNVWAASDGSSTSNWVGTSGGPDQPLTPGAGADVVVSNSTLNTAPTSTVLGANMSIKSLTISDTANGLGLNADGYKLTITPASSSAGIMVAAGVPASSIGANIGLGANQTWTNNSSNPFTVSGGLSGSGALTIAGTAPVVLSGANVNTAGVGVINGILSVSSISDSGVSNIGNAGGGGNYFAMVNGTLLYTGAGTQSSSRAVWVDQPQTGSTFNISQASGNLTLANSGGTINKNITKTGPGGLTLGGNVNGTMSLAVNQGTLTLTGNAIDYTGATTVSGGRLVLYNNDDTWTSGLNISSGAAVEIYRDNSTTYEHRGAFTLSGAGTLEKTGNGPASMNWDQGGTVAMASGALIQVKAGTMRLEYGALSNWTNNKSDLTVDSGAAFDLWDNNNAGVFVDSLNGSGSITRTQNQTGTLTIGVDNGGGTFTGAISNAAGLTHLTKTGGGTQTLASAASTYSGVTTVNQGLLIVAGGNAIGDGSAVVMSSSDASAQLQLNASEAVYSLAGGSATAGAVNLQGNFLQVGFSTGNATTTYSGVISGSGGLVRRGAGTTTLAGANAFTGLVRVQDSGAIAVDAMAGTGVAQPLGAGTGAIQLQGGTLSITGAGTSSTDRGLELVSPNSESGTLSVAGTLNMSGDITGGSSVSTFTKTGAGTFNFSGAGDWSGNLSVAQGTFNVAGGSINGLGSAAIASGATLSINTSQTVQTTRLDITSGGTVRLEAGTLRVAGGSLNGGGTQYSINQNGTFDWTGGTLAVYAQSGLNLKGNTDRSDLATSPSAKEGSYLSISGNLTVPAGSTVDLGGVFLNGNEVRYNQVYVTGTLGLTNPGTTLNINLNPYFLRPFGYIEEYGTLVLGYADVMNGTFGSITGIGTDGIGWTFLGQGNNTLIDASTMTANTYAIEYRTGFGAHTQSGGDVILLHYKVTGVVPEPGSAGLLIAGAVLIRTLRRRLR